MQKSLLLIRSNLRKSKGQSLSLLVLILIAACLLNIWLILSLDYSQNFDRRAEMLHTEDAVFVFQTTIDSPYEQLAAVLDADNRTDSYTMQECLAFTGNSRYRNGEMNTWYIALAKHQALHRPRISGEPFGEFRIIEEDSAITQNAVWLPYLYKMGGDYAIGDDFDLTLLGTTYHLKVAGFYENMMIGSFNGGICTLLFDSDTYQLIRTAHKESSLSALISVKLKNCADNAEYAGSIGREVLKRYPVSIYNYTYYDVVKQARTLTASICTAIIYGVAFLTLLIGLVVLSSNIASYIGENMKKLGTLKAVGYTTRQLRQALLLQFALITLLGAALGIGLSYLLFPSLSSMLIAQTGIPYSSGFILPALILAMLILFSATALTVLLSTRKIKHLEPIVALRQGIQTHSFHKNWFPLSRSRLPLHLALAFKITFTNIKQNIAVLITVLALSLLTVFSCVMLQNFIVDSSSFLGLAAGERADAMVGVYSDIQKQFLADMQADDRVEKVYLYTTTPLNHEEAAINCYVIDDAACLNNPEMCYEGRMPLYANELAIGGSYAQQHRLAIGDTVTLSKGQLSCEYLICGLIQCTNYLGRDCSMLLSGYEQLGQLEGYAYYLDFRPDVSTPEFLDEISSFYGDGIASTANVQEVLNGSLGIYQSLVSTIVVMILLMTLIIILFVLYLMVKILLLRKKQDYGILKALGFTTGQLILQTALSFMPSVVLASAIGFTVSSFVMNPLLTLFFRGIGVMKCTFTIPLALVTAAGISLTVFTFIFACLLLLRIRKVRPRELLTE